MRRNYVLIKIMLFDCVSPLLYFFCYDHNRGCYCWLYIIFILLLLVNVSLSGEIMHPDLNQSIIAPYIVDFPIHILNNLHKLGWSIIRIWVELIWLTVQLQWRVLG